MDQTMRDDILENREASLMQQLNQLQKDLEQLGRQRRTLARLGTGLPGDAIVQLVNGRRVPIRQLLGQKPAIWTMSSDWKIIPGQCADVFSAGRQNLLEITLASGRIIRITGKQRLFGPHKWVSAADLKVNDRIAIARKIPEPTKPLVWQNDHLLLLGHLVGDGSYLKHQPLRYTSESEENLVAVTAAAERAFGVKVNRNDGAGNWDQLVFSGNGDRWHPAAMNKWLRDLGIFDQNSHIKHLPPEIFQLSNIQIAFFLQHAWATDGCVYEPNSGKPKDHTRIFFSTCSRMLVEDIAALLLRLGFVGRIRKTVYKGGSYVFSVDVSGADNQISFLNTVGAFGPRLEPAQKVLSLLESIKPNTNVDTIPIEVWDDVKTAMWDKRISHSDIKKRRGKKTCISSLYKKSASRPLMEELAEIIDDDKLRQWAHSGLFWDKIVKIESAGKDETFNLVISGPACYLADSVICHDATN